MEASEVIEIIKTNTNGITQINETKIKIILNRKFVGFLIRFSLLRS
jgi:hypothetical protein